MKLVEDTKGFTCKGLVFRAFVSSRVNEETQRIYVNKQIRLLKKKSCNCCEKCAWLWDFFRQDIWDGGIEDYLNGLEDTKLYRAVPIWSPGPYEYPQDGDLEIEFKEIKEK